MKTKINMVRLSHVNENEPKPSYFNQVLIFFPVLTSKEILKENTSHTSNL